MIDISEAMYISFEWFKTLIKKKKEKNYAIKMYLYNHLCVCPLATERNVSLNNNQKTSMNKMVVVIWKNTKGQYIQKPN